jgi:hypothetical protein
MSQIDAQVVANLSRAWPIRAAVCSASAELHVDNFDISKFDYPTTSIPFFNHPLFQQTDIKSKHLVAAWAWMGYNKRTITTEDYIVNPALQYISTDLLPATEYVYQEAIRQTLIDEHYHTLLHLRAMNQSRQYRHLTQSIELPNSIVYRKLRNLQAELVEPWEKSLAQLVFATVSELSINAFLEILASNDTIQPANSQLAQIHLRDEYAHSKTLAQISKIIYNELDSTKKQFFIKILPQALSAFIAQDFSMWKAILQGLNIPSYNTILAECVTNSSKVIIRDYSGIKKFAEEINILDQIDFEFV